MSEPEKVVVTETTDEDGKPLAPLQEKPKRTEAETTAFNLRKQGERARELGLDPAQILGVKTHIETAVEDEDDKPVTVGMLRSIQKQDATKTALQMTEEIQDEDTRTAVKEALENSVKPSGDAEKDFRFALGAVSAGKNKQVLEEVTRYVAPKRVTGGGSMPAHMEEEFVPTAEEAWHMQSFGLTKEKVLAARKASADKK